MRDFNRNDRGGGRGGRRFGGGGRDFGKREMYKATCAECGRDCEVPFRPKDDRPVYCSDCFEKKRNEDGGSRRSDGRGYGRPNFEERRSYPPDRGDRGSARGADNGQLIDQLKSLNIKLDRIISILQPKPPKPPDPKIEITDVVAKPKVLKKKDSKKKVKEEKVKAA